MSAEVVVYGEALVDLIPDGEGNYQPRPGGSPFNVAVALARLGVDVAFLAPFSEDAFGCKLVELLEDEGVEILVTRRSRRPTSIAIVEDSDAGPRYSLYRTGVADTDISLNQVLSVLRAHKVKYYLVYEHGIRQNRIESEGFGESKPKASNDTDTGRERNRRVDFKIIR